MAANQIFRHAYASSEEFRAEHALLLLLVQSLLRDAEISRRMLREYQRLQVFELFLPQMLAYLDGESLAMCEIVCTSWRFDCMRFGELLWGSILRTSFGIKAGSFRQRSRSLGGDDKETEENVSAKSLYKLSWVKQRLVLRGAVGLPKVFRGEFR